MISRMEKDPGDPQFLAPGDPLGVREPRLQNSFELESWIEKGGIGTAES